MKLSLRLCGEEIWKAWRRYNRELEDHEFLPLTIGGSSGLKKASVGELMENLLPLLGQQRSKAFCDNLVFVLY